jgi:hypothetical protein
MITMLRRSFWLALLGGAGYAMWITWQRQHAPAPVDAPEWPPLDPPTGTTPSSDAVEPTSEPERQPTETAPAASPADAVRPAWVAPVDGNCPDGFPIKANDNSGIYHLPGGRFYARTVPERCYARTEDAEADGYRAAKS